MTDKMPPRCKNLLRKTLQGNAPPDDFEELQVVVEGTGLVGRFGSLIYRFVNPFLFEM